MERIRKRAQFPHPVSNDPPMMSLGFMVEKYLADIQISSHTTMQFGWTRGLASWYMLNHFMIFDRDQMASLLHPEQMASYRVLYDWWTAAFQDPGLTLSTILIIVSLSDDLERIAGADMGDELVEILRYLELHSWPCREDLLIPDAPLRASEYHRVLWNLFQTEFSFQFDIDDQDIIQEQTFDIRLDRQNALASAYAQQAAASCLTNNMGLCGNESSLTTIDDFTIFPPQNLDLGPAIRCCTWLPALNNQRSCMPYYLWDVFARRTVRTESLVFTDLPVYTCVSHTWGRWRLDSQPNAHLEGVPWSIPRNSRFDVEDLPNLLGQIPTKTPYVWFDLICIPQDGSLIGDREIARQGEIFRSAQFAVAWLNDIPELESSANVLRWMVLQFLHLEAGSDDHRLQAALTGLAWARIPGNRTHLFSFQPGHLSLNPWFTSLWTLQETCLRPDMWLCARDWTPLRIDGQWALPLNGLVCIINRFRNPHHMGVPGEHRGHEDAVIDVFSPDFLALPANKRYYPFWELDMWMKSTGLGKLLEMSRVDIISFGDRRHCTGRRGEAIMSALGVTDWYIPGKENDCDLVLGKYPLPFLEELKRKDPGDFFGALNKVNNLFDFSQEQSWSDYKEQNKELGSILPFGSGLGTCFLDARVWGVSGYLTVHPSLLSWSIEQPDGHVRIKRACVLSAPGKAAVSNQGSIEAEILPQGLTRDIILDDLPDGNHLDDLHGWVQTQQYRVYPVVTKHCKLDLRTKDKQRRLGRVEAHGILLREITERTFLKVGTFHVMMDERKNRNKGAQITAWRLPDEEQVDWMVL